MGSIWLRWKGYHVEINMIGLSGYARSGKDSVADFLVADHGFTKVSFAQPMRDALYALNPRIGLDGELLQDIIDEYGWDGYKKYPEFDEIRILMQRLGTEVARKQWHESFWVDLAVDKAIELVDQGEKVVFTDVRFPNEAEAIEYFGGQIWRINREGVLPANAHASETAMDVYSFECIIDNDGTLEDLGKIVDGLI